MAPTIHRGDTKGHAAAYVCEECGGPLEQKAGRGRLKKRHTECKAFSDAFAAMDRALAAYRDSGRVDYATTRDLRSRLWKTANTLNTIGDDRG